MPDLQLSYAIAFSELFGMITAESFTTEQQSEIESLGGIWFDSYGLFLAWMDQHNGPLSQVIADRNFGQQILNDYLVQNKLIQLSTNQSLQQLQKFGAAKQLLEAGAISSVLAVISGIAVDEIFTQERKDFFIDKITDYLA